jgi:hypothetical protein
MAARVGNAVYAAQDMKLARIRDGEIDELRTGVVLLAYTISISPWIVCPAIFRATFVLGQRREADRMEHVLRLRGVRTG